MVKEKSIHTTVITNMQHSAAMHATQLKIYRRKTPPHHLSPKKLRTISAVTSIGSFVPEMIENTTAVTSIGSFVPEMIENTTEKNSNNIDSITSETRNMSASSKSHETKVNRPPTAKTIVRIPSAQPSALITDHSRDPQPIPHHTVQKPICSKIISDQVSKHSASSRTEIDPKQPNVASGEFDPMNAESFSKNSFQAKSNFHSEKQIISDRSVYEKTNQQKSYLTDSKREKYRRRRFWNILCPCCSPFCCLLTGLLLSLLFVGVATVVTVRILLKPPTKTTTTIASTMHIKKSKNTLSSINASSMTTNTIIKASVVTTTVTITQNACTSSWNGVSVFNLCTNCSDINPYQQYVYSYVAIANQTRITFALHEDVGYFALDDISVRSTSPPSLELLINGGFETGNLSSWIYCNPAGSSNSGTLKQTSDNFTAQGQNYSAHGGNYYYVDGAVGQADYLSQMFATNIGQMYNISFWLYNQGNGSNSDANIIISI